MLRTSLFSLSLSLSLAACAETMGEAPPEPAPEPAPPAEGACDAGAAVRMVGMQASEATGARILRFSGARSLRWGPPDSAWTMDYRPDRVNVRYDRDMRITEITCG
jgi:hypothetical protein